MMSDSQTEAELRLARALSAAHVIVWEYDVLSRSITHEVPGNMLGIPPMPVPLSMRRALRLVHPQDRREVIERARSAVEQRSPYIQHFRLRTAPASQPIWVEHHGGVVCEADGRLSLVGAMIDITAHKQALEVLEVADRRKDEFLATLAHELRNPLTAIGAAAKLLRSVALDAAQAETCVDMIRRQAAQLCRLVDDLLDLSHVVRDRLELKLERVDLKEVVTSALETTSQLLRAHQHQISVTLPDRPLPLDADPVRLAQLFGNLLTNAIKYTPDGGRITVFAEVAAPWVQVHIRDSGLGISPEQLPHLFEPFYQADSSLGRAQGGLGIGLALVRRIAQLHGGSVSAQSAGTGQGSEFIVRMRLVSGEQALHRPAVAASTVPLRASRALRILVADDNADVAETLSLSLRLSGHQVQVAHDGEEALRLAEAFRPHAALLDVAMPKRPGHEVAQAIRTSPWASQAPPLLVALTGWNARDLAGRLDMSAFDSQMIKPPDIDAVRRLIEGAADRRR